MLQQHVDQRRRRHRRLHRGAAHGGDRLRRHACRRPRTASSPSWKSPPIRRHAGPSGHRAGQHGHLRVRHQAAVRAAAARTPPTQASSHDFGKDIIPKLVDQRHAPSRITSRPVLRPVGRRKSAVLARRRHGRRLSRGQYRPDRFHSGPRPLRPRLADLDLRRGRRRRPSSSTTRTAAAAAPYRSLVSGGCIVSGAAVRQSLLFTGVRVNSYSSRQRRGLLPDVEVGRSARLHNVVVDRGVRIPPGLVVGEDPDEDARRFRRTDNGDLPDHPGDDRPPIGVALLSTRADAVGCEQTAIRLANARGWPGPCWPTECCARFPPAGYPVTLGPR